MIVVLQRGATDEQLDAVVKELESYGLGVHVLLGGGRHLLHVVSGPTRRAHRVLRAEGVEALVRTSGPRLRRQGHRIYPYHFIRWCAAGIVIFGAMVFLAGLFPPGTHVPIPTAAAPAEPGWPWYLRPVHGLLSLFPSERRGLAWALLLLFVVVVLLLPVLDRTRGEGIRGRWPFVAAGLVLVAAGAYLAAGGAA